jgi:hypothetical protein
VVFGTGIFSEIHRISDGFCSQMCQWHGVQGVVGTSPLHSLGLPEDTLELLIHEGLSTVDDVLDAHEFKLLPFLKAGQLLQVFRATLRVPLPLAVPRPGPSPPTLPALHPSHRHLQTCPHLRTMQWPDRRRSQRRCPRALQV